MYKERKLLLNITYGWLKFQTNIWCVKEALTTRLLVEKTLVETMNLQWVCGYNLHTLVVVEYASYKDLNSE